MNLCKSRSAPGTLIYHLRGYDPDGDSLTFGIRTSHDSDIIKIENIGHNEANIYLAKELDREVYIYKFIIELMPNINAQFCYLDQR